MITCKCKRCAKRFVSEYLADTCELCLFFMEDEEYKHSLKKGKYESQNDKK